MINHAQQMLLFKPYQFQLESAKVLWKSRYGLSADEMGLGKSLEAILCAVAHMAEREDAKIIFCVPAFLKASWEREIGKFTIHIRVKACLLAKDIPDKWDELDAIIINYEQLEKTRHLFKKATMVVVDEVHYLKTPESKRTQFLTNFLHDYRPERLLLLSGTPIKNRIPEYFSLIKLLDLNPKWEGARLGKILGRYLQFCEYFCHKEERNIPGKRFPAVKWVGFRNEQDFFSLLRDRYVRHLADEVLNLEVISYQDILTKRLPAPGEDPLGDELREMWENYLLGIESSFLASRKLESALLKVPYTIQFAQELITAGVGPLVVFSDHVNTTKLIGEKWGKSAGVITGETPIAKRDAIVSEFQKGNLDVLAATTGTMSAGWTLTRSSRSIFNDLPWVPGDFMQAVKRIHRIGQDKPCFIYNIVTTELDFMIMQTLKEKTEVLKRALVKTQ